MWYRPGDLDLQWRLHTLVTTATRIAARIVGPRRTGGCNRRLRGHLTHACGQAIHKSRGTNSPRVTGSDAPKKTWPNERIRLAQTGRVQPQYTMHAGAE
jgi:hypothetical protein